MTTPETFNEPSASEVPPEGEDELWLTYLNYDNSIQQAVRRLGALSQENVDVFRALLLKERKRSRVKEYEAESIRQLQGEAFVGDEGLQRTLIVLNAEDPRYGEELKRRIAADGKPEQMDRLVAEIRGVKPVAGKGEAAAESAATVQKDVAPAVESAVPVPEPAAEVKKEPAPKTSSVPEAVPVPPPAKAEEPAREAEVVPLRPKPVLPRPVFQEEPKRNFKLPAAIAAVLLIGAAGAFLFLHGKSQTNNQAVANAKLQAAASATAAAEAVAPAQAPDDKAAAPSSEHPSDSAAQQDRGEPDRTASASPPLRPATTQPDTAPPAQSDATAAQAPADATPSDVSPSPVAGQKYKVVRGDMLSDIALKVYGDAHKWRLIQAANPSLRHKPDYIMVDQVILIPVEKK